MKTVQLNGFKSLAPERMSQLTPEQLLELAECFTYARTLIDTKVMLAAKWLPEVWNENEKLVKKTLKIIKSVGTDNSEAHFERLKNLQFNRVFMTDLFDWIAEYQITDQWLTPSLNLKGRFFNQTFVGPNSRFESVTFWQWCQAEMYFFKYIQTNSRDAFNRFCACLFMPKTLGKIATFDDKIIEKNVRFFSRLTQVQVTAIRINYIAIKAWLALNHPHVFVKSSDDSKTKVESIDLSELLLRAAKSQMMDEEVVARKPLLVELKKLEIAGADFAAQQNKPSL